MSSKAARVLRGVPQGSILGPLLYILYTNDKSEFVNEEIVQFADDTSVILHDKEEDILKTKIADTMKTIIISV